jgi:hypothetical protein
MMHYDGFDSPTRSEHALESRKTHELFRFAEAPFEGFGNHGEGFTGGKGLMGKNGLQISGFKLSRSSEEF